ncbi:hypothetical protein ACOMHN_020655 [Nucella lapillus]
MSFEDFCRHFTHVDVCHMMNTSFFTLKKTWREQLHTGEWRRPQRVGGCGNHPTFLNNPQFLLEVYEDEEEMLVSLEQEDRRSSNFRTRGENYCIGFTITKTDLNRKYRMHDRMDRVHAGPFVQARSILTRIGVKQGRYLLVPSTFDPGQEGRYLLRLYTAGTISTKELIKEEPSLPKTCMGEPKVAATAVTISSVEGFSLADGTREAEVYCIMMCEGQQYRTTTSTKSGGVLHHDVRGPAVQNDHQHQVLPAQPYLTLPYLTLPHLTLPYLTLPDHLCTSVCPEAEVYCIMMCEGQQYRTTTSTKSSQPEFKERVTFYRKKPTEDVKIEVWDSNMLADYFLGSLTLPMTRAEEYTGGNIIRRYSLAKSNSEGKEEQSGYIWLTVKHTTNMAEV